eukprot:TRINITY_DN33199_c0_g1_i1.p1 TRINITY_DN33199_c0_g1~~TRINITY_DN33199_c0_g1_i1.p1  ORF type:complete len:486 (+),score=79.74 TRINITY_DN33199_c0_g1_i1:44-1501(+)
MRLKSQSRSQSKQFSGAAGTFLTMPTIPQMGEVTVCEINRDLLTSKQVSDAQAKDAYAKILGLVFHPIPFQAEKTLPIAYRQYFETDREMERDDTAPETAYEYPSLHIEHLLLKGVTAVRRILANSLEPIFSPIDVKAMKKIELCQGVSWHKNKHILAFISGPNQVFVFDFQDSEWKEPSILGSESQKDIEAIEWRPNGGTTLSVACREGICIWTASYPGNVASVRAGVPYYLAPLTRGANVRWTLVDTLKRAHGKKITTIAWSPNGRFLASGSHEESSIIIWDVAQGVGTPLRRGLGGTSLLKWSPTGDYLFSAKLNGTFSLWETVTWASEPWSSSGGCVTSATWSPDGQMLLMAFSESLTLGALHFAGRPPSLDAQLLPVELPEIGSITGGFGNIEKMAWDGRGERLAVSYSGGDPIYAGLIAVYDTRRTPIVSALLVGFIRGPGEQARPLSFGFHDRFKQGPLLSVCWSSGMCCTYPLIVRA